MTTKLPPGLSFESKLEHIIEQIVLNVTAPDNASADDIRASIRELARPSCGSMSWSHRATP